MARQRSINALNGMRMGMDRGVSISVCSRVRCCRVRTLQIHAGSGTANAGLTVTHTETEQRAAAALPAARSCCRRRHSTQ